MAKDKKISVGILGFGGRGEAMAEAIKEFPDKIYVKAIAEPEANRRQTATEQYGVAEENIYCDYNEFLKEGVIVDLLIITTMDTMHYEPIMKAMEIGYKTILLEKPISIDLNECIKMAKAAKKYNADVIVLHTLRYGIYYRRLKEIIDNGELGDIMGIRHSEGASLMNYSHSFVRGNWANTATSAPFILQKSCHDTDIIVYLTGKKYKKISSIGSLTYFKEENAPEGCADKCVDCERKYECSYNSLSLYRDPGHKLWYESAVTKHGYSSVEEAMQKGRYGRCVYKCDNNVTDQQVTCFEFEDGTTGTFAMTAFDFGRRTEIQGSIRTLRADETSGIIEIYNQLGGNLYKKFDIKAEHSTTINHHSSDIQLTMDLIEFINEGDSSKLSFIEGALQSHLACFAAEISRKEERTVYISELIK